MATKWSNWVASDESLKSNFETSIKQNGAVVIKGVLDHVAQSGMTRHISLFIPIIQNGKATMICIAREAKISGCGMDMGFELAYRLYNRVYGDDYQNHPYQNFLSFSWL